MNHPGLSLFTRHPVEKGSDSPVSVGRAVAGNHPDKGTIYSIVRCQVFLKLDKSAFLCASSLAPRTLGLLFLYAVEIGKEIALFSIPTATTT